MANKQIDDLIKKSQVKHSLNHSFQWLLPLELTKDDLDEFKLIKGVAMSEGQLKDGDVMTRDNVIAGAGAMRASAIMGMAQLDIDHYESELPKEYIEKYGEEIGDPYPPGLIVDAQAVENTINGKKIMQVEYIAIMFNDFVYDMIKDHKIKGNSVVDYPRSLNCDKCNTDECSCEYSGSVYMYNTLILDEVPNSNNTWVDVITESDIGHAIKNAKGKELKKLKHQFETKPTQIQTLMDKIQNPKITATSIVETADEYHNLHELEGDLDSYMSDGMWNDGQSSAVDYLMEEKAIDEETAQEMAEFLFENPDILSQYQLRYLSSEDLMAWWSTFNYFNQQLKKVKRNIATLSWLEHNSKPLRQLRENAVAYGQGEVSYGQPSDPESNCMSCRWFSPHDYEEPAGTGICAIVAGDVEGILGCDQFSQNPLVTNEPPMDEGEEPPMDEEPTGDEPPMEEPPMGDDEIAPDENGECPDGYMLSEDGTMCIRAMSKNDKDGEQSTPVPEHKIKHQAKVEKSPETHIKKQVELIDTQLNTLKTKQKRLQMELRHAPRFYKGSHEKAAELEQITKEINRLEILKKK